MKKVIEVDFDECGRCGVAHFDLLARPFVNADGGWTHYTECPILKEPILLRLRERTKDDE